MKKCPECGGMFKNLGAHMRKHSVSKNIQEQAEEKPITRLQSSRLVVGGAGVIMRR